MAKVKVLVVGQHTNQDGKVIIGSSVVLVQSEDKNIIVDAGSFLDKATIIEQLNQENLTIEDIDTVLLTHIHLDHIVNTNLFTDAKVYCKFRGNGYPGQVHDPKGGYLERIDLDGMELTKDVKIISTPGHTEDMLSVLVTTDEGLVAIVGDTIASEDWINPEKQPLANLVSDLAQYNESRNKILEIADYIIPGHGPIFKLEK